MNELAVNFSETMQLGEVLAKSGFFQDSQSAAQAIVKILAGRELGFGPVASMTGVNVIKGKVSLSANLIAASVKRSGRYNYRVAKMDDTTCTIKFFEGKEEIGESTFTMADAKQAGLAGDNWRKFPKNMLFARAMSNGAKWFCPDLSGGPLYTPDELGAEIDGETGEMIGYSATIELPAIAQAQPDIKQTATDKPTRPYAPETLRAGISKKATKFTGGASQKQQIAARLAVMSLVLDSDPAYRAILTGLFNKRSSKELTGGECSALIEWAGQDAEHQPNPDAVQEAAALLNDIRVSAGQASLFAAEVQSGAAYGDES